MITVNRIITFRNSISPTNYDDVSTIHITFPEIHVYVVGKNVILSSFVKFYSTFEQRNHKSLRN
jgi:hypothetical protein